MRRWVATLIDIAILVVAVLWPAVTILQDVLPFDGRTKVGIVVVWIVYQWIFTRFLSATLGQRIAGYRIVPSGTKRPQYLMRVFYAYFMVVIGIQTLTSETKARDDVFWWDRKSNTRAVLIRT